MHSLYFIHTHKHIHPVNMSVRFLLPKVSPPVDQLLWTDLRLVAPFVVIIAHGARIDSRHHDIGRAVRLYQPTCV